MAVREGISITIKSVYEPINVVSRPGSLVLIEARGSGNIKPGTIMIYAGGGDFHPPLNFLIKHGFAWMNVTRPFRSIFFFFLFPQNKKKLLKERREGERLKETFFLPLLLRKATV